MIQGNLPLISDALSSHHHALPYYLLCENAICDKKDTFIDYLHSDFFSVKSCI